MSQKFYEPRDLVDRLCSVSEGNDKRVVFLVGSALSLPDHGGGYGVPGVSGIVDLIRREFAGTDAESEFASQVNSDSAKRYQNAFEFLHGRRGQDWANRIIRAAVWQALNPNNWPSHLPRANATPNEANAEICKELESLPAAWSLPRAVTLFGGLLVNYADTFGGAVLTTNFDPLVEVSVLKHGGRYYSTVLHEDGNLQQTVSQGTHVVHLHGYWWGYDTLHTPQQLGQPRPQLRRSLTRIVETSTLVVLGYGGWDDVITQTLMELVPDSTSVSEILWAFHDDDRGSIEKSNEELLRSLAPGIGRGRVQLYRGVDCCSLLSDISTRLDANAPRINSAMDNEYPSTPVESALGGTIGAARLRNEIDVSSSRHSTAESDSPLFVDPWVGRDGELDILNSSNTPVVFVTGLGGQGKSALAGRFLQLNALGNEPRYEFWDWRDCKEESDRLNTQILRLVERLSGGTIDASIIESTDILAVVGVLFNVLRERKALLVFDNVDQYVDLDTLRPVKGLDILLAEALGRTHQSRFLFTCRPNVRIDESRSVRLPLEGLTEQETLGLMAARGVSEEDQLLARELHRTTKGHPLWINLILLQAVRQKMSLSQVLQTINSGGVELPDTTRSIWGTLNSRQKDILRTMAELDRPESESQLARLLPGITFNRLHRALNTFRSFHLIEVRSQPQREALLGLHPLIREFVRVNFPKQDRERYASAILDYLEQMIEQFQHLLGQEPSYPILEYWIRKADFQMSFGHFEEATATITEIAESLVERGFSEELIRVTMRLLSGCDWAVACSSYKNFDALFNRCLTQMIQMGHDSTQELLERYESAIPGKSSQYIMLCNLRCYSEWYQGKYQSAIAWGERGEALKAGTSVDTAYSTTHNLALARRDAGNRSEALQVFLGGETLEAVLVRDTNMEERGAHFYGNVGRCLFLSGDWDGARLCYVKSAQLLQEGRGSTDQLNRGYIRLWIAELLAQHEEFESAAAFYRAAVCIWDVFSPPRSVKVRTELTTLVTRQAELAAYQDADETTVERTVAEWLAAQ